VFEEMIASVEEEGEEWEYAAYKHGSGSGHEEGHTEEGLLLQPLAKEASLPAPPSQEGAASGAMNRAMRLCETLGADTRAACARLINYVLKMSRKRMKRWGSRALAGGAIGEGAPIPNPLLNLLAKASGAYLRALGQAMLNAVEMPGKGSCFLSFHTFKLPFGLGDTGVPDGAYAAGCHR
jgi:hypothetical protein